MRVYWIDEIIQYIEEKVVDYLLENSVRRQINKVERKFITKKKLLGDCQYEHEKTF